MKSYNSPQMLSLNNTTSAHLHLIHTHTCMLLYVYTKRCVRANST